jgi:DNA mismatch repair protein MutH
VLRLVRLDKCVALVEAPGVLQLPPDGPPPTLDALLARAQRMAGCTLGDVARALGSEWPEDLRRAKGFVGNLFEQALGTDASTLPAPDFQELGVELKTLPVDRGGRPRESTWVCTANIRSLQEETWETSRVRAKLSRVLFMPVESEPDIPHEERRVGAAIFWQPDDDEELLLRADWEDLASLLGEGLVEAVSARRGHVLQVRPKAADASVRKEMVDTEGEPFLASPRGFYLRRSFTTGLVARAFGLETA